MTKLSVEELAAKVLWEGQGAVRWFADGGELGIHGADGDRCSAALSANLHRRHMTVSQQAAIVASAQDWAKAQTVGGNGANQHRSKPATLPDSSHDTVAKRAATSGASERTQRMADKVARKSPEFLASTCTADATQVLATART